MELKIAGDELERALSRAQGIVDRKTTMPILANVLLSASKGVLKVTAFDLDIGVVSEHPAEVLKEGEITLQARTLFDIVKNLPEAAVHLRSLDNHYVEITSGQASFKIVGMAADQYPPLPKEEKAGMHKVDGKALLSLIAKTSFAISVDETRYVLNGVFLESAGGGAARMVATDGHRLALSEQQLAEKFDLKRGVIVPRKGLFELKRLLEEAPDAEVFLGFSESSGMFRKPGLSMVMRLIDGQFPEYGQVIPKVAERTVQLRKDQLLETLKRVSLLSAEKAHAVKLQLEPGVLRISSQNPELGEAKEEVPVAYKGKSISIGFNARYLIDGLQAIDGEEVKLELGDDSSPGVLRPVSGPAYTAVIMPMRI